MRTVHPIVDPAASFREYSLVEAPITTATLPPHPSLSPEFTRSFTMYDAFTFLSSDATLIPALLFLRAASRSALKILSPWHCSIRHPTCRWRHPQLLPGRRTACHLTRRRNKSPPPLPPVLPFVLDPSLAPPHAPFVLEPSLVPPHAPEPSFAPPRPPPVQVHSHVPTSTKAHSDAPQYPEPAIPHAGTVGKAPSSGPQRTRAQQKVQQKAQQKVPKKAQTKESKKVPKKVQQKVQKVQEKLQQAAKKGGEPTPNPFDENGVYPVSSEEPFNTKKVKWKCPFPDCKAKVKDTEGDMGRHFSTAHPLEGGGKHSCALLVKEKTGSQEIRTCAKPYEEARGLGRHVLVFHMGLGQKTDPILPIWCAIWRLAKGIRRQYGMEPLIPSVPWRCRIGFSFITVAQVICIDYIPVCFTTYLPRTPIASPSRSSSFVRRTFSSRLDITTHVIPASISLLVLHKSSCYLNLFSHFCLVYEIQLNLTIVMTVNERLAPQVRVADLFHAEASRLHATNPRTTQTKAHLQSLTAVAPERSSLDHASANRVRLPLRALRHF
ncbi:hypothetical protein EVG20_g7499 [Dentipellis fragilis]|uniref:Uncharacterized protein n=1 Tax=Dentipellis fragilis TaxID=205917 RepID=A0A4Y9YCY1_9AGAM|nr:hypothetical protein EVG20_g7499 [Dentipellis fragilis]